MKNYICASCGEVHNDLPTIGYNEPYYYQILNDSDKVNIALLSSDLCRIKHKDQTDYFIRGVLHIPILDHDDTLIYGIWVSVSENTFKEYFEQMENDQPAEKTFFGRISNWIGCYEENTIGLHMNVDTQLDNNRPIMVPHESNHPLVSDWENGVSYEEAERRIANAFGED